MAQQPTMTERLVHVIRTIQLGYLTGQLIAQRGSSVFVEPSPTPFRAPSGFVEEGTITFVKGKVTDAHLGRLRGSDALNSMSTWGKCVFSFVMTEGQIPLNLLIDVPTTPPTTGGEVRNVVTPLPPSARPPQSSARQGPDSSDLRPAFFSTGEVGTPRPPTGSSFMDRVPLRLNETEKGLQLIERMALSRMHRRLFLLIDGRRTVAELARLMSYDVEGLQVLLQDLERIAVVKR